MTLELFHVYSPKDIDILYEKVILNKRKHVKLSPKFFFNKCDKKINVVSMDISHGCTLRCSYCYLSAGYHKKEMMSKDKFLDVLSFLYKTKSNGITFYFAGEGEPTLNFRLLKQIPELCRENGFKNCHFEITTNGTLLFPSMIKFFEKEKFSVSVSLDGNEENDSKRIFLDGSPSFPFVIKNVIALKKSKVNFACKATIMPDNKNVVQLFQFFEDNEIPFYHGFATRSFDGNYIPQICDVRNNLRKQMNALVDYYVQRIKDNKIVFARKILEDVKRIQCRTVSFVNCSAGINSFYFDLRGDIYVCSSHNSCKELSVGSIREGIDYDKIENENYYPRLVDSYDDCKNCWLRHLCSGSCIAAKWIESKDTTKPSEYHCLLNKTYWEAIIKLYILIRPYIKGNINFRH